MSVCRNCGNELAEGIRFCPNCGCEVNGAAPVQRECAYNDNKSDLVTIAKAFMIVGTVITGLTFWLIPLAWCIPMTIYYFNALKRGEQVSVAFKICSLLFVSQIAGILMLCDKS